MQTKQYDFASMNEFVNDVMPPEKICSELRNIAINLGICLDETLIDEFKDEMITLKMLIGEFEKLKES